MTLRTHVISTMRFDGHLSDGYPSTYGHVIAALLELYKALGYYPYVKHLLGIQCI